MHRWMIAMVRADYHRQKLTPPASWKRLPPPDVAQIVYKPVKSSAGRIIFRKDVESSGNMVPSTGEWVKTPDYFASIMRHWEANYTNPTVLASLSLGALGNLLEFTIHNAMHNRWLTPARDPDTDEIIIDPDTGQPGERPPFDFADKWSLPKYDYLGEFFSSHVNPVFWGPHGWVDDRTEDWFRAQEASRPGLIQRRQLHGVDWFQGKNPWVMVDDAFVGVSLDGHESHTGATTDVAGHDHHGGPDPKAAEIETMLKIMAAIEEDQKQAAQMSLDTLGRPLLPHERVTMFSNVRRTGGWETGMSTFEAIGNSLEEALTKAHDKIPPRQGRDYVVSRVVTWGMQSGGFVFARKFYAVVEEDLNAHFRTDPKG